MLGVSLAVVAGVKAAYEKSLRAIEVFHDQSDLSKACGTGC